MTETSQQSVIKVDLNAFLDEDRKLSAESQQRLVITLIERLQNPPYWLVLVTKLNPIDCDFVKYLLHAMSTKVTSSITNAVAAEGMYQQRKPPKISSTRVRVDPDQAARKGQVTRYSRTPDALPLHTDGSNKSAPQNLVAFAMEKPDANGGGESVMLAAEDLVKELPDALVQILRQPVFPFATDKRFAILTGEGDQLHIRYYRNQIATAASTSQQTDVLNKALDDLDQYLVATKRSVRCHMTAGDVMLMDNRRVLHGRSEMAVNSERLMHRYRLSIPALEPALRHSLS